MILIKTFTQRGLLLKIVMKSDQYFSDGRKITSSDFIYSLKLMRNNNKSKVYDNIIEIRKTSKHALEIKLRRPSPHIKSILASHYFPVLNRTSNNKTSGVYQPDTERLGLFHLNSKIALQVLPNEWKSLPQRVWLKKLSKDFVEFTTDKSRYDTSFINFNSDETKSVFKQLKEKKKNNEYIL